MYYFIINPNAGSGRGWRIWRRIASYLDRHSIEYQAILTNRTGDGRRAAGELTLQAETPGCILVVGGDGTLNEVLDGLSCHLPVKLGYIPAGKGSDLARSLRISAGPIRCLRRQLAAERGIAVDYGALSFGREEVRHRRFLVSAGIGYDAAVCQAARTSPMRDRLCRMRLYRLAGLFLALGQIWNCRPSRGYIILDGTKKVEFNNILFISCHIQPTEGGGFLFAPRANGGDGLLEICVTSHPNRMKLIPVILSALTGSRRSHRCSRHFECREISIHTDHPLPVHADGESCGIQTEVHADCISGKVRMLI